MQKTLNLPGGPAHRKLRSLKQWLRQSLSSNSHSLQETWLHKKSTRIWSIWTPLRLVTSDLMPSNQPRNKLMMALVIFLGSLNPSNLNFSNSMFSLLVHLGGVSKWMDNNNRWRPNNRLRRISLACWVCTISTHIQRQVLISITPLMQWQASHHNNGRNNNRTMAWTTCGSSSSNSQCSNHSQCSSQQDLAASLHSSSTATCSNNNRISSLGCPEAWVSSTLSSKRWTSSPNGKLSSSRQPPQTRLTCSSSSHNLTVGAWVTLDHSSLRSKTVSSNSKMLANTIMDWLTWAQDRGKSLKWARPLLKNHKMLILSKVLSIGEIKIIWQRKQIFWVVRTCINFLQFI